MLANMSEDRAQNKMFVSLHSSSFIDSSVIVYECLYCEIKLLWDFSFLFLRHIYNQMNIESRCFEELIF